MKFSAITVDVTSLGINTPDGFFTAHYSKRGLARLDFPNAIGEKSRRESNGRPVSAEMQAWHKMTTRAVREVLAGGTHGELPPLDLSAGTEFQQSVWNALRKIARGRTKSYGEVAAVIGRPKALRAVGGACGANPIPLLVPCHRVLAANHKLGGFSGGLDWKRKLLGREGLEFFE